jgi:hypothetical protein
LIEFDRKSFFPFQRFTGGFDAHDAADFNGAKTILPNSQTL